MYILFFIYVFVQENQAAMNLQQNILQVYQQTDAYMLHVCVSVCVCVNS